MAQIKLELQKEIYIPYKVIIKMEKETDNTNNNNNNRPIWEEEENYYYGQHWKLNSHNYNN